MSRSDSTVNPSLFSLYRQDLRCHGQVKCPGLIPRDNKGRLKVGPQYGKAKPGCVLQKAFQKTWLKISQ